MRLKKPKFIAERLLCLALAVPTWMITVSGKDERRYWTFFWPICHVVFQDIAREFLQKLHYISLIHRKKRL